MYIESTNSTNTLMKTMLHEQEFFTIWTGNQTAGRGQAGNSWESEPGKNLTFSVLLHVDDIPTEALFRLSMLVPLAIVNTLNGGPATIKWPNDIYIGDKKVCGILIENVLGEQRSAIVGIGLNVNQRLFVSPAPNPTSLAQETGRDYELEPLLDAIIAEMRRLRPLLHEPEVLKREYMSRLYRREGYHPYVEREVSIAPTAIQQGTTDAVFEARILDVEQDGHLVLETRAGQIRKYHFKQIRYVL